MIYTALKKFDRALYFLEVVITTPAMAVSHIMLEAYKKYILVSLILHGKVWNPPMFIYVDLFYFGILHLLTCIFFLF